ncbi:MAG: hypothetical protein HFG86_15460 [Dorea sp.]|jgi:DNA-binding HxlR family transcriptional regulator|nr:hypothetical protein [Dorea sp.]
MEKNLPACPVETTLMLISDRWKVLIILTKTGYSLKPILDAMVEWGTEYKKKNS